MLNNIAFKDYKKSGDIHGTVLYPAVMIAPVQKNILNELILENDILSVFDPFHGSGTALYEAMEISPNIHLVGCDINPLANLITKVKLQGVKANVYKDIEKLKSYLADPKYIYPFSFPNMDKWLRKDVFESLKVIRSAIMHIKDDQNRLFFWYMLCDIIRKHSNTRSSTYKLHIKDTDAISRIENKVAENFIAAIEKNADKFMHSSNNFILYKCDVLKKMKTFDNKNFDVSITSPPYGENATTVPYGQFSMLALYTIPQNDLELEGWELENYSIIDSNSMGGINSEENINEYEKSLIKPYLDRISVSKHRKVIRFFSDYFQFLEELCRVTDKYIVLTLGNRTVDRVQINLTDITKTFLERRNFCNVKQAQRDIPIKRTPKVTSVVHQKPVSSMNSEYIIIHKRNF
ncbi:TRM11 family methyltransferase [Calidifontibacillus oryziterrae]|uniref:hypothetical protein n=1 Tax=Calidifontibacillus oryziterrae TaxID=1191699 RepID=UPI000314CE44|nr:hypothetical protein [Calidifontibacillus oryziterrae]